MQRSSSMACALAGAKIIGAGLATLRLEQTGSLSMPSLRSRTAEPGLPAYGHCSGAQAKGSDAMTLDAVLVLGTGRYSDPKSAAALTADAAARARRGARVLEDALVSGRPAVGAATGAFGEGVLIGAELFRSLKHTRIHGALTGRAGEPLASAMTTPPSRLSRLLLSRAVIVEPFARDTIGNVAESWRLLAGRAGMACNGTAG